MAGRYRAYCLLKPGPVFVTSGGVITRGKIGKEAIWVKVVEVP